MLEDFSMVESLKDRWKEMGQVARGKKKISWLNLVSLNNLLDISKQTSFSWANNQLGDSYMATRLYRVYMIASLYNEHWFVSTVLDTTMLLTTPPISVGAP